MDRLDAGRRCQMSLDPKILEGLDAVDRAFVTAPFPIYGLRTVVGDNPPTGLASLVDGRIVDATVAYGDPVERPVRTVVQVITTLKPGTDSDATRFSSMSGTWRSDIRPRCAGTTPKNGSGPNMPSTNRSSNPTCLEPPKKRSVDPPVGPRAGLAAATCFPVSSAAVFAGGAWPASRTMIGPTTGASSPKSTASDRPSIPQRLRQRSRSDPGPRPVAWIPLRRPAPRGNL